MVWRRCVSMAPKSLSIGGIHTLAPKLLLDKGQVVTDKVKIKHGNL